MPVEGASGLVTEAGERPRILVLSGPNLQLLGTREPEIYGVTTLAEIHERLSQLAKRLSATVSCRQSNHEGQLLDWLGEARGNFEGVLINAGAFTHTSVALGDALDAVKLPAVEVHLSNPERREPFRHHSMIARACLAKVSGFGALSYEVALEGLVRHLRS